MRSDALQPAVTWAEDRATHRSGTVRSMVGGRGEARPRRPLRLAVVADLRRAGVHVGAEVT